MLRNLNNISRDANRVGSVSETAAIRPPASMLGYDPTCQGRTPLGRFSTRNSPRVGGNFSDPAWRNAASLGKLIINLPSAGRAPSCRLLAGVCSTSDAHMKLPIETVRVGQPISVPTETVDAETKIEARGAAVTNGRFESRTAVAPQGRRSARTGHSLSTKNTTFSQGVRRQKGPRPPGHQAHIVSDHSLSLGYHGFHGTPESPRRPAPRYDRGDGR